MEKGGYIYIMTNKHRTTLYIGVTNDLERRVQEHRSHYLKNSFTTKYNLEYCVYYEYFWDIEQAIERETQLKKWSRSKKEMLINSKNPEWKNLDIYIYIDNGLYLHILSAPQNKITPL